MTADRVEIAGVSIPSRERYRDDANYMKYILEAGLEIPRISINKNVLQKRILFARGLIRMGDCRSLHGKTGRYAWSFSVVTNFTSTLLLFKGFCVVR